MNVQRSLIFALPALALLGPPDNADLQDHDPYQADRRRAFNGRGLAILRAAQTGLLRIAASASGLKPASLSLVVIH